MIDNHFSYIVKKHNDYALDINSLYELYLPIVGAEALSLYMLLNKTIDKAEKNNGLSLSIQDLLKFLNFDMKKLETQRALLEAIGLLDTYLSNSGENNFYTFIIKKAKNFNDFNLNYGYQQLLINKIGKTNYEYLEYLNTTPTESIDGINVSNTFDMIFNNQEQKIRFLDFNKLYSNISKVTSLPIVIDKSCKQLMENYFNQYNFSLRDVENIIYQSTDTKENQLTCDLKTLKFNLNKFLSNNDVIQQYFDYKINRDFNLFKNGLTDTQKQDIINDYCTHNSLEYLQLIFKHKLDKSQILLINELKNKYKLIDKIINVLIDYCLYRTKGKLNKNYLVKMAQTINALNLTEINGVIEYLIEFTTCNGYYQHKQKNTNSDSEEYLLEDL